ncbi:hypothetical protein MMC25_007380 [Agyrium rufum]|nr:hypothetical protein [Agyrium rufum]
MSRPLAPSSQPLQLITEDIERFKQQSRVDKHRLDRIYEAHRCHFWSMVAADYGDDVAPSVLEDTWISSLRNLSDSQQSTASSYHSYPPTPPNCSPQSLLATTTAGPLHSALGITMEGNESSNPMGLGFRPINFSRSVLAQQSGPRKGSFAIASILNEEDEAPRTSPIREEI